MADLWEHAGKTHAWIRRSDRERSSENFRADRHLRLMKVFEEAGEAAQALIGVEGQNPRKGVTHSKADVASELCDVIIAAVVAMHDYTHMPEAFFTEYLDARSHEER